MSVSNEPGTSVAAILSRLLAPRGSCDRRVHPRLALGALAALRVRGVQFGVVLRNISDGGAAIQLRSGLVPSVNDCVDLTLIDGTDLPAVVIRQTECECESGIAFLPASFRADDHLTYEHMGSDYFRSIVRMQRLLR